ncbi:hypothetical protein EEI45_06885 [Erysipelothrix piscisicarius]|uniref:BRCT domain-containing protein n=1 Tax=Erysipelothrix piscisicarius TaxID=2485784 RepID=A0A3S8RNM7_9FIRM|nr:exonuclease domain-containing protein [Erysipelothrix piscisicarius]AZK44487.1 hypothetical protein EEI45_06885 [Erysipelothrix piscisicarius]
MAVIRKNKGNSILEFRKDYTILNVSTTDFDYFYGKIIRIQAKKYRDFNLVSEFDQFINPGESINPYITQNTGITNEMVQDMPLIHTIAPEFLNYIKDDIIVGHNINFDINFLYDSFIDSNINISNDFIDTLRLSRIIVRDLSNHKLNTLVDYFNINDSFNRTFSTEYRNKIYLELYKTNIRENSINNYLQAKKKKQCSKSTDFSLIRSKLNNEDIDDSNLFFGKHVCITGKLIYSTKAELYQALANLGAKIQNNVTKDTDYLILGDLNYQHQIYGTKSIKHLKGEKMIREVSNLEILTEVSTRELINS